MTEDLTLANDQIIDESISDIDELAELNTEIHWDTPEELECLLEAVLFAADRALSAKELQALFTGIHRPAVHEIEEALISLQQKYAARAIELFLGPKGYRFHIRSRANQLIKSFYTEKPPKYSAAFLETLSLIAYKQPITRGEIEEVRGVAVSSQIMKNLEERGWIRRVGHKEVPGRPTLWATTAEFLEYFNLQALDALPPLADIGKFESLDGRLGHNKSIEVKTAEDIEIEDKIEQTSDHSLPQVASDETTPFLQGSS